MLPEWLNELFAANIKDDSGNSSWDSIKGLLPFIVLAALGALNKLVTTWQEKKKAEKYAREEFDKLAHPEPASSVKHSVHPTTSVQSQVRHQQASQTTRRIVQPQISAKPRNLISKNQRPVPQPKLKPVAQRLATTRPVQFAKSASSTRRQTKPEPATSINTQVRSLLNLDQPDELARAVVYSEILGPPVSLRS